MSIEPVKTVAVAADEVTAPAKIEVNPNRVGHAVLPVPGRIVQVMTKLGDSVEKGPAAVYGGERSHRRGGIRLCPGSVLGAASGTGGSESRSGRSSPKRLI